jgi:hypothetical protein
MGCSEDEYDPEVEDLVESAAPVTAGRVTEVFASWFWDGCITAEQAERIAVRLPGHPC